MTSSPPELPPPTQITETEKKQSSIEAETVVAVIDPSSSETITIKKPANDIIITKNIINSSPNTTTNENTKSKTETTFTLTSNITTSTSTTTKSIDEQLADLATAKQKRRLEMSIGSLNGGVSTLGKVITTLKSADHETIRLSLITLALVSSFFGAILLVISGPDPPIIPSGALYTYSDLMRLMTAVHERSVEIVPNSLSKREWIEALKNGTLMETTAEKWRELLSEWWPIKPVEFQSADRILEDSNFYARNYRTFQGGFIVFCCLSQVALLLSWAYFLAAKELRAGRRHKELELRLNGNGAVKSRVKSPKLLSERVNHVWAKTRRFFGGGEQSSFKSLKKSWFDDPRRPLERPLVLVVGGLLLTDLLLFVVLMCRPNFFTLVLHQAVFVLLAVVCLASTQEKEVYFQKKLNGSFHGSLSSSLISKEVPRSLRNGNGNGNGNGSTSNYYPRPKKSVLSQNGGNKVHQSPELKTLTEPLIEGAISGTATPTGEPIFVTEQSQRLPPSSSPSNLNHLQQSSAPSLNPFGSFDEEDDEEEKGLQKGKTSPSNKYLEKNKNKRPSIDEEAEKEVEQV